MMQPLINIIMFSYLLHQSTEVLRVLIVSILNALNPLIDIGTYVDAADSIIEVETALALVSTFRMVATISVGF